MSGVLQMGGNLVRGLPTTYPPLYQGDEVTSWAQAVGLAQDAVGNLQDPTDPQNAATKNYVDTRDDLRVLKAGDTMSGDLRMSIGSDTVRLLGCDDLTAGRGFSLPLGNLQNQLQFAVIPPPQNQTPVTMQTTHGFLVQINNELVCQLGDPGPDNQVILHRRIAMNNNLIKFLQDLAEPQDAATKNYVDSRKPVITVWAEENGSMTDNEYEWSFGNGGSGGNANRGYPMLAAGRVLRMGLAATANAGAPGAASVNVVVNGVENASYGVTKPSGQYSGTSTFGTPLELAQGDRVNFRSASTNTGVTTAVVSLLIELDL